MKNFAIAGLILAWGLVSCEAPDDNDPTIPTPPPVVVEPVPAHGLYWTEKGYLGPNIIELDNGVFIDSYYAGKNKGIDIARLSVKPYQSISGIINETSENEFVYSNRVFEKISKKMFTTDVDLYGNTHIIYGMTSQYGNLMTEEQFKDAVFYDHHSLEFGDAWNWIFTTFTIKDIDSTQIKLKENSYYKIREVEIEDVNEKYFPNLNMKRVNIGLKKTNHNWSENVEFLSFTFQDEKFETVELLPFNGWHYFTSEFKDLVENYNEDNVLKWLIAEAKERGVDISDVTETYDRQDLPKHLYGVVLGLGEYCSGGRISMGGEDSFEGLFSPMEVHIWLHEMGHSYFNYKHPLKDPNGCDSSVVNNQVQCSNNVADSFPGNSGNDIMGYGSPFGLDYTTPEMKEALDRYILGTNHTVHDCNVEKGTIIVY